MAQTRPPLDLIAIGRSSVDLYGLQIGGRLEDVTSFGKYVGGSPTNTAVGATRLGLKAGLITRVGADHMGRFIREELQREGVDVSGVVEDPERLTALVLLGLRDPDTFPLIFYRENCADMALEVRDIDTDQVRRAAAVLINGTHLSRPNVFEASLHAARAARESGGRVVFDIDYRPVLWGLAARDMGQERFVAHKRVTAQLQRVLPLCDLIVGTAEEIHILGGDTATVAALNAIRARTEALVVCKLGAQGCVAFPGEIPKRIEDGVVTPGFPVEVYNVLGAGDAFMAGFLRGWLREEPLRRCCELANAAGAIVVSRHGCAPAMPTWPEIELLLSDRPRPYRLRDDAELEHVHWATTRRGVYEDLAVLAIDHRNQFEDLAKQTGAGEAKISVFKTLGLKAVDRVAQGDPRFGVLLDGRHGMRALEAAADRPYWIGRPIEYPQSCPLEFEASADVGADIAQWPANHVVKVLALYHPDDPEELSARQERQLLRLFDACRKTRHELLVEIIASKNGPVDSTTTARAIERLYARGIRPDWWKLEPVADATAWSAIERTVRANDPYCRGVLLLGLSVKRDELVRAFSAAAGVPIVKGFAVGRTIFNGVAEKFFGGEIDEAAAVDMLAANFGELVDAWRDARSRAR